LIDTWKQSAPAVDSVFILDDTGRSLLPSGTQPSISRLLLQKAVAGQTQISDILVPEDSSGPAITFYVPIRDHRGTVPRVLIVRVKANAYWNLVDSFDETDGPGSFASLINEKGIFLACGMDRNAVFRPAGDLPSQVIDQLSAGNDYGPATKTFLAEPHAMPAVLERIKRNVPSDVFTTSVSLNSEENEAALTRLKTKPWYVVMTVPHSSFYSTIHANNRNSIRGAVLVMIVACVLGFWLSRAITSPIKKLASGVEQLSSGSLDVKVAFESSDEFGRLGNLFNQMTGRLKQNITELETAKEKYRQLVGSLEIRVEERTEDYRLANQQLARLAHREKLVNQLTNSVRSSLDLDTILRISVDEVGTALNASRCLIRLPERDALPIRQEYDAPGIGSLEQNSNTLMVISQAVRACGKTMMIPDVYNDPIFHSLSAQQQDELRATRILSCLAAPIIYRGENLGLISLHDCTQKRIWTDDDISLLETVSRQIAVAIANARLFEETVSQAKQIEAKTKEIEQFVYTVSHDLKAPLVSLQGISQILIEDSGPLLDDEGKRLLDRLQVNAHHMELLIQGLLALSRIGRVNEALVDIDSNEVVRESIDQFYFQIKERSVEVKIDGVLPGLRSTRTELFQVFSNLIGNGIKFLGKDNESPAIEIGGTRIGNLVEFYVRDNGIGIDEKYHSRIFGVFQRLQEVKDVDGTGIGLAIVQKIVERNGGRVWVESSAGHGSTFRFTWRDQRVLNEMETAADKTTEQAFVPFCLGPDEVRAS
jgi:signal transduction histidine kinase/HAMP domain-containing protein